LSERGASQVFDGPSLWRIEAAQDLGLGPDELIAAMSPGPAFPAVLRTVEAAFEVRPRVIVDLGAGTGGVSEWLRVTTGATVYAVEPEDGARRAARHAFPHLHVVDGSADAAGLPGGVADAVVLSGVISLMSDIDAELIEVDRLLTRSGSVAIADLFSGTDVAVYSTPNVFRSVEDVTRTLHGHGFSVTELGLGDAVPDPSWAAAARRVDEWIEKNCSDRQGYLEWRADRRHLQHHIESDGLFGGCIVARNTS